MFRALDWTKSMGKNYEENGKQGQERPIPVPIPARDLLLASTQQIPVRGGDFLPTVVRALLETGNPLPAAIPTYDL